MWKLSFSKKSGRRIRSASSPSKLMSVGYCCCASELAITSMRMHICLAFQGWDF